jgi:hypothetical protein
MAGVNGARVDLLLAWPTDSLVRQLEGWQRNHPDVSLRRTAPGGEAVADLTDADLTIIDATDRPREALEVLARICGGSDRLPVTVYSERMHEGLELFVRQCGILLLLGPMEQHEWEALSERLV